MLEPDEGLKIHNNDNDIGGGRLFFGKDSVPIHNHRFPAPAVFFSRRH